jgi:protein-S-isoprenylcysteine O-methyltransferase Ste14
MREIVFWAVVAGLAVSILQLVLSIARPELRLWPPPGPSSRRHRFTRVNLLLGPLTVVGVFALGVLDWSSLVLPGLVRLLVGVPLFASGGAFALWGYFGLGVQASQGRHEGLVASGAYRYSRNPQYVGTITCLLGYAIACSSGLTFVAWLLWSAWFIMAPFAEEPWLRDHLGPMYDEYARQVPRFLALRALFRPRRVRQRRSQ